MADLAAEKSRAVCLARVACKIHHYLARLRSRLRCARLIRTKRENQ